MTRTRSSRRQGRLARCAGPLLLIPALAAVLPASAPAARAAAPLSFSPARPLDSQALTVTWRADRAPRRGYAYRLEFVTGDQVECASNSGVDLKPTWKVGARIRVTLRPVTEKVWCLTSTRLRLVATRGIGPGLAERVVATVRVPVRDNAGTPIPERPGTDAKIRLLDGSALTVRVAGRPDRTTALTGTLNGRLPGRYRPNTDLLIDLSQGALSLTSLPADPLCTPAGAAYPATTAVSGLHSSMTLDKDAIAYLTLLLEGDPLGLTGCQGQPGAASLPVSVAGRIGPTGLVRLELRGTHAGITLSDGAQAELLLTLVVNVDLSGR
jgi:hypothetical protein